MTVEARLVNLQRPVSVGQWTPDALKVMEERYLWKDDAWKVIETPEGMCWRVSCHIASSERAWGHTDEDIHGLACQFYELMTGRKFFPNAPTLYNAGKGNDLQLSACFVKPIPDTLDGIYEALKRTAIIHKSGGGTGFSFSRLRPKGSLVRSSKGKASGPVSFLRVFNTSTESVKQGGTRRGANMAELRIDHPDILEFIDSKSVLDEPNQRIYDRLSPHLLTPEARALLKTLLLSRQINNFNISAATIDRFMEALAQDGEYDLVDPQTGEVVEKLKARDVFNRIVQRAWLTGDPGMWFVDRTNHSPANPLQGVPGYEIEATNPCGEQPLWPNDACNLGSIALDKFVTSMEGDGGKPKVNWPELERVVRLAVRFLDDVIEFNPYPYPEITEMVRNTRRIGLGVMGWADMLALLGIPYASEEAVKLAEQIMRFINDAGHKESERLAEERGPFPLWPQSIYKNGKPIRNCTVTTIAPTGEIRLLAGCSGGIEPFYGLTEVHKSEGRVLHRLQPGFYHFIEVAKARGFWTPELEEKVRRSGRVGGLKEVPEDVQAVFATTHEIPPRWHVLMQAAFQKHTDNAVSKTINLPNSATVADVAEAYQLAWETGCLGITVFRDGCKGQVLSSGLEEEAEQAPETPIKPRPKIVLGATFRVDTPEGGEYVTINFDTKLGPAHPFEMFIGVGKAGSDVAGDAEGLGRAASLILRIQSPLTPLERLRHLRDQWQGIGGRRAAGFGEKQVRSPAEGAAMAIDQYFAHFGLEDERRDATTPLGDHCPQCGNSTLVREEGCKRCTSCNHFEC